MLQFGMPTLLETPSAAASAALCRALSLQFVELNMNLPQYQPHLVDAAALCDIAEKNGIFFTIHLDENLNVSDFNPRIASAYLETTLETIRLSKRLSAPIINMHLAQGVYFTLPDRRVYLLCEHRALYLQSLRSFRDACTKEIGESNIQICIENSSGYLDWQVEALDLLLESPAFALTYDIGHNLTAGGGDEAIILARSAHLCHMHLHDAAPGRGDHLALGTGALEIERYLQLANQQRLRVVLETKTVAGLTQSVQYLRERC